MTTWIFRIQCSLRFAGLTQLRSGSNPWPKEVIMFKAGIYSICWVSVGHHWNHFDHIYLQMTWSNWNQFGTKSMVPDSHPLKIYRVVHWSSPKKCSYIYHFWLMNDIGISQIFAASWSVWTEMVNVATYPIFGWWMTSWQAWHHGPLNRHGQQKLYM